ncbi:OmpA family protein [Flavivirga rizhaonensis]|uniref:Flagellar motor protein MotB n=1 Tax=Flavivirga rizhaonensis TaxID=2559571 RepID=A0A4S1DRV9_9FLAO|nr:OmpA family protein [Flavivirga rizhaonensis]TGV00629.1 flagellar motor protein MotB [Flavivirga rizhaonensis]
MKKRLLLLPLLTLLLVNISFGQKGVARKAKKTYNNLSYVKTTEQLLEVANEGNRNPELLENLANSFYYNGKMEEASQWYGELIAQKKETINPENYFRYSQALKGIGAYDKADKILEEFIRLQPEDSRSKLFQADYLETIEKRSDDFEMNNLEINTPLSDFGTSIHQDQLIFASSRGEDEELYNWNEQPFLDIYELNADGTATEIKGAINTKYHESSTAFTKDGKTVYFTRNNYYKGEFKKNSKRIHGLKIYKAELKEEGWTNIEPLSFNSDDYNVAHPALSADETKLYFASDMEGTLGASDIYVVTINEDGSYGEPKNLGSKINTEGRENFPYISNKGTLYFSSDGHPGLGGLDVFAFKNIEKITTSNNKPINVGKPINSSKDDFEYIINETTYKGYLSSNRKEGKGDDDIYSFTRNPYLQYITGTVLDKNTNQIIAGADVFIYNHANELVKTLKSDENGEFSLKLSGSHSDYKSQVTKANYKEGVEAFNIDTDELELQIVIKLEPNEVDLFKLLDLNPIYFDFDKAIIRPEAEQELVKIINYMKAYPNTKVDVRSHTDSRGNKSYNLELSKRRNKSTINYLIKEGSIDASRLTGKGYGETILINKCITGVKCSEEEHQANRRSEFILVED